MSSFLKKLTIKPVDIILLIVFLVITAFSIFLLRNKKNGTAKLLISTPGAEYVYDLSVDRIIKIEGIIGTSIIKIQNGSAHFEDSPCPGKTCVQCAPIRDNLEWTACLPNQVFIRIERQNEDNNTLDVSSF
ncbi:MAG: NusG domain II-containing protein [Treponema sp.]|nr:NusG domain II-containing protein [Treponema sp.]